MKTPPMASLLSLLIPLLSLVSWATSAHDEFLQCLHSSNSNLSSKLVYTPRSSLYESVLESSLRMQRLLTIKTPKPLVIVTPLQESHIQATIKCAKQNGLEIRVRSGGHDYEGLSYVSYEAPFVIIDLANFRSITIDDENNTAWVQVGVTLGELYYTISQKSQTLSFSAGVCPTVGAGGHFSGGGYGMMSRNYGLAVDNIIDARLMDVNGTIHDRKSMGEDLFWAIRGGGGASFGVIIAWKIKLLPIPEKVTVFTVNRTLEQDATKIVHRWQNISVEIDQRLLLRLFLRRVNSSQTGRETVQASFVSLFVGGVDTLLPLVQESFPELGLVRSDCIEMTWIESILYFAGYSGAPLDILLNRTSSSTIYFKGKSDYVTEPISEIGLEQIWKRFLEYPTEMTEMQFSPYGGRLSEISESATPFPHRAGTLYSIHYGVFWTEAGKRAFNTHMTGIRRFYNFMTPYVTKNPRSAYLNYRDLDVGVNNKVGNTSYEQASIWGLKYYGINFKRLVNVKTEVDPGNFFRNEQSIPAV